MANLSAANMTTASSASSGHGFQVAARDGTIFISGTLDFTTAKSALAAVNEHLVAQLSPQSGTAAEAAIIDLAGVTSSNSAALALMIEWLAEAQRANRELQFQNIPDSLRQISTVCQVDSLI